MRASSTSATPIVDQPFVPADAGVIVADTLTFAARGAASYTASPPPDRHETVLSRNDHARGLASHFSKETESGAAQATAPAKTHDKTSRCFFMRQLYHNPAADAKWKMAPVT